MILTAASFHCRYAVHLLLCCFYLRQVFISKATELPVHVHFCDGRFANPADEFDKLLASSITVVNSVSIIENLAAENIIRKTVGEKHRGQLW